nr:hypothetical protein [Pseudomonas alkylphenolica]
MEDRDAAIADALEALHLNQIALRSAIEELSTWVHQRGSVNVHDNTMTCLQTLDVNADAIASVIDRLRN